MTSIELRVEEGGIPHLAKNERDVGHPAFVAGTGNPVISLPARFSESAAQDDGVVGVLKNILALENLPQHERQMAGPKLNRSITTR